MLVLTNAGLMVPPTPLVYLDHCALRKFSTDDALAVRLGAALKKFRGSLAVSWLNLGEYATVTDEQQRLRAEQMLDRILPAICPINVDAGTVSKAERAGKPYPYVDMEIGQVFVQKR